MVMEVKDMFDSRKGLNLCTERIQLQITHRNIYCKNLCVSFKNVEIKHILLLSSTKLLKYLTYRVDCFAED